MNIENGDVTRFGRGVYICSDSWEDYFYLLQRKYSCGIYSLDTALFLLVYSDSSPAIYTITFHKGYNSLALKRGSDIQIIEGAIKKYEA